jgi:hypothetical protein
MADLLNESMNAPEGRLARVLVDLIANDPQLDSMRDEIVARLDRLMSAPSRAASLAKVRLAADVSVLHQRLPEWTEAKIVPLFDWKHDGARDYWSARKYAPIVGSPQLTALTKGFLLALFDQADVPADDKSTFAEWLVIMAMTNAFQQKDVYPIELIEIRSAMRKAGVQALSEVAHRLAVELGGGTPASQAERWRNIVGPVFKAVWPLDVELTSDMITFKLVQILVSTGDAIREAAGEILPFVRREARESGSTLFMLGDAPDHIFTLAADIVIELSLLLLGGELRVSELQWLRKIQERATRLRPQVADTKAFRKLAELLAIGD